MASKRCKRCLSIQFFDVSSCLYLWKVAHAALILLLISNVSCWWNETLWPKYFTLSFYVNISMLNSPTLMSFCVRIHGALIAENLLLVWVDPESHFLGCFLEFIHHVPQLFFGGCEQHHVVGKSQVREAVSVLVAQVNSHSFFLLPSLYFVLLWVLKYHVELQAGHQISLLGSFWMSKI